MKKIGFTLIEVLLVISLIFLLGGMTSVFMSRFLLQSDSANVTDQIAASLRRAQMYSMLGRRNSAWGVNYSANKITLFSGNTYATRTTALDQIFNVNSNISISGFSEIVFAKVTGLPNTTVSATIVASGNTRNLSVNSQGTVSQ